MITIIILIIICVFLYRSYAELAHEYDKPRIGFGIAGIAIYFVSYILLGTVVVLIIASSGGIAIDFLTGLLIELGAMAAAAGVALFVRSLIKKSWVSGRASSELLDRRPE